MLSDPQIERYCRQIVLPEWGSRGQERLLAAVVAIVGGGDASLGCATYLAAAGVGEVVVDDPVLAAGLAARNPDARVAAVPDRPLSLDIRIGAAATALETVSTPLLAGAASATTFLRARFAPGAGCTACWSTLLAARGLLPRAADGPAARMLGTVLAAEALRILLALAATSSDVLEMDLRNSECRTAPFPFVEDCAVCGKGLRK